MNCCRAGCIPSRRLSVVGRWAWFPSHCAGFCLTFCVGILAWVTGAAVAAEQSPLIEPFTVRNQNPFILVHGLPAATAAGLLSPEESSLQLQLDISNHSVGDTTPHESIVLDGETYRAALIYKRGLAGGWQLGVELPVIAHRPGMMDNMIEGWHNLLGLSNGGRDPWPKNRLLLQYERDGIVVAEMRDGSTGLGDLQLQLSRRLAVSGAGNQLALNASLKLPTGDSERFQGSGAADLALWLNGAGPVLSKAERIGGYWQAGLLLLGEGDLLPAWQRDAVLFGSAGLHWYAWNWLMVKAQLDAHGSFYKSGLDQLGRRSVMLTVGGSIATDHGVYDLAIGENLATDTVPDFMINFAYRRRL